ncbi:hypothetical protein J6590_051660 [Homalodisca vitripennis]|nr:hypothetical protein J6590_051660 [Homalodisca vitripennis]
MQIRDSRPVFNKGYHAAPLWGQGDEEQWLTGSLIREEACSTRLGVPELLIIRERRGAGRVLSGGDGGRRVVEKTPGERSEWVGVGDVESASDVTEDIMTVISFTGSAAVTPARNGFIIMSSPGVSICQTYVPPII